MPIFFFFEALFMQSSLMQNRRDRDLASSPEKTFYQQLSTQKLSKDNSKDICKARTRSYFNMHNRSRENIIAHYVKETTHFYFLKMSADSLVWPESPFKGTIC